MKRTGLKKYEYADVEHFTSKPGLRIRKIMNKSWHIFLKLGTTRKIHIVDYPQLQKGKNYIFACNHSFDEDVISTLYAIDRNAYVLNGSKDQTEHNPNFFALWANGMIYVNRCDFGKQATGSAENEKSPEWLETVSCCFQREDITIRRRS